jgi:polyhydroxyalkanoate synthesis regulator phasin
MKRSYKVAVGAALVLSATVAGAAIGATKVLSPKQESQAVIEDAAGQLGVTPESLSNALKQALKNRVDEAVKDGRLTREEGTKLKQAIDAGEAPLFGLGPGPEFRHHGAGPFHAKFEAAADYLGMSEAQLRRALESGKTLAQVAKDRHKSVDGLVDALLAGAEKKLDRAVASGQMTEAEKKEMLAGLRDRITDLVNGRFPAPPRFPRLLPDVHANPFHAKFEAAADYLGMTEAQLRQALESGKTLAQVAKDRHKSVAGLVDALLARAEQKLDAAVDAGEMTEAEKTEMMAGLKKRLTDLVNGRFPEPSFRFHRERIEPRPPIF